MRKRDWFVILAFLGILAFLFFVVRPAKGDDELRALTAQLEAKTAAKKPKAPPNSCPCCTCVQGDCGSPLCQGYTKAKPPTRTGSTRPPDEYPIPYPNDPTISAADAATHPRAPYIDTDTIPNWDGSDPFAAKNAARPATIAGDQPDNPWVLYPDGSYYRYTPEQMRQRRQPVPQPVPYYQPMTYRSFGGGCSSGSCR